MALPIQLRFRRRTQTRSDLCCVRERRKERNKAAEEIRQPFVRQGMFRVWDAYSALRRLRLKTGGMDVLHGPEHIVRSREPHARVILDPVVYLLQVIA